MDTLTRKHLEDLGIPPGPIFKTIFNATKGLDLEEAISVAQAIQNGTWEKPKTATVKLQVGSVWHFVLSHPAIKGSLSNTEARRLIEQGGIRINWSTLDPDEVMPEIITEITLFPKGERVTVLWCLNCGPSCQHAEDVKNGIRIREARLEKERQEKKSKQEN